MRYIPTVDMYRVRLIMAPGFSCSDYVNASYVDVSVSFLCVDYTPSYQVTLHPEVVGCWGEGGLPHS